MQTPRGRYVKLNPVDYLLIGLLCLLALSLLIRGVLLFEDRRNGRACEANVEFMIREVDQTTCSLIQTGSVPFRLSDGTLIEDAQIKILTFIKYVPDESGEMRPVISDKYNVRVSFRVQGAQASDNAFLLNGVHRLATGEKTAVTWGDREFKVDFTKVEPIKA